MSSYFKYYKEILSQQILIISDNLDKHFNFISKFSILSIIERYTNEDIAEGYRLTRVPHKRPDCYTQPMDTYLKTYFNIERSDKDLPKRLERKCSFNKKSLSSSSNENSIENALGSFRKNSSAFNSSFNELHTHHVDSRCGTIGEVSSCVGKQLIKQSSQTSIGSTASSKLVASKSISSPLSELANNSTKPAGVELTSRKKTDKIQLRGYLNKYSKRLESFVNQFCHS